MADFDLKSDEEKAEELKAWWKENGLSVVAGIALTVAGMFGWNYWKDHQLTQSEGASKLFARLSQEGSDPTAILDQIKDQYGSTAYVSLAAMNAAKASCEAGNSDACIEYLRTASNSSQDSLSMIAKVRLARALVSSNKLDEAEKILDEKFPTAYQSLINELTGDIHFAKKEFKQAREAYDKAILSSGGQGTELLKMKRDDLGDHLKKGA